MTDRKSDSYIPPTTNKKIIKKTQKKQQQQQQQQLCVYGWYKKVQTNCTALAQKEHGTL